MSLLRIGMRYAAVLPDPKCKLAMLVSTSRVTRTSLRDANDIVSHQYRWNGELLDGRRVLIATKLDVL
jgi:hypothetical protein